MQWAPPTTLLLVVPGVMVVAITAMLPLEETKVGAETGAMAALPQATMGMVAMEAVLLVVCVLRRLIKIISYF